LQTGVDGVQIMVPAELLPRANMLASGNELTDAELNFLATGDLDGGDEEIEKFAQRYSAAWSGQDAAQLAACYAPDGSLSINENPPSVGREAIAAAAQAFMSELPDMVVTMQAIEPDGEGFIYRWNLKGTNSGPEGNGNPVDINGYEEWTMSPDGLIQQSLGHMDEAEYQRQLGC
jgi:uncharacterized protein (TIGR02246 family)